MTAIQHHAPRAGLRVLIGLGVGLAVATLSAGVRPTEARILLGWVAFCAALFGQLWPRLRRSDPGQTRALATREDDSRAVAGALTVGAALVSLVGVGFLLSSAQNAHGGAKFLLTGLAVLTVAASWLLVHTEYTLHYARRYYGDGGTGVLFLEGDGTSASPTYQDFAYLSLTIGMTYQVSDTNLNTRAMRRLLLGHALLSYVFGTVIIAVTISGVAGLIQ